MWALLLGLNILKILVLRSGQSSIKHHSSSYAGGFVPGAFIGSGFKKGIYILKYLALSAARYRPKIRLFGKVQASNRCEAPYYAKSKLVSIRSGVSMGCILGYLAIYYLGLGLGIGFGISIATKRQNGSNN